MRLGSRLLLGLAAIAATAHDIILTIGFIALMRLEVSLVVVGAVLSMVMGSLIFSSVSPSPAALAPASEASMRKR